MTNTTPASVSFRNLNTSARGLAKGDRIIEGVSVVLTEGFGEVLATKFTGERSMLVLVRASDGSEGWVSFMRYDVLAIESPIAR